MEWACDYDGQD